MLSRPQNVPEPEGVHHEFRSKSDAGLALRVQQRELFATAILYATQHFTLPSSFSSSPPPHHDAAAADDDDDRMTLGDIDNNGAKGLHINDLAGDDESAPLLPSNSNARALGDSRRAVSRKADELKDLLMKQSDGRKTLVLYLRVSRFPISFETSRLPQD